MDIKNKIIDEIRKIYDPELPVNIYELGLIYDIKVNGRKADIKMTGFPHQNDLRVSDSYN